MINDLLPGSNNSQNLIELYRTAKDFCVRKFDTIFYGVALPAAALYEYSSSGLQGVIGSALWMAPIAREAIRAAGWKIFPDPPNMRNTNIAFSSIFGGLAALNLVDTVRFAIESDATNTQKSFGMFGLMGILYARELNDLQLSPKEHFKLYRDVLFNYYDKNRDEPRPRVRDWFRNLDKALVPPPNPN